MIKAAKGFITKYWLIIFIIIVGIFVIATNVPVADLFDQLFQLQLWQLLVLLLIFLISVSVHIASRKYILGELDVKCGYKNLSYIYFVSLAAHYSSPAKIGYPLAVYLLNKMENVPYTKGAAMILIELVISTLVCGVFALFTLGILSEGLNWNYETLLYVMVIAVVFVAAGRLFVRLFSGTRLVQLYVEFIDNIRNISFAGVMLYLSIMIIMRFIDGMNLYLLVYFYDTQITIWQATVASSAAFFFGAVSMIPMGIGARDISLLMYLQYFDIDNQSHI